jgi:hypothetical protein
MTIQNRKGDVMNNSTKLALVILATAAVSGCASTRTDPGAASEAAAPAQVSKPAASYGSMGGYRYRRLITVTLASSS